MIQVSNLTAQTLVTGQAVTFDRVIHHTGNCECFSRQAPTSVRLMGGRRSMYEISFNGNITNAADGETVQLAIALGTTVLTETAMNAVPAATGNYWNVAASTCVVLDCSDIDRISVVNAGPNTLNISQNANLCIRRVG